ncbi:MAG: tetratricopeptide repeat protein [Desulfosporosinus sp.]|nr:tetratricopeptide repeat protein [Desulfosporosinus sp.]
MFKNQKFKTFCIIALLAACIIGAGAYGFFSNQRGSTSLSSTLSNSGYLQAKNRVGTLTQQLNSSPNDIGLQQDLGNAYYDLGTIAQQITPNEAKEDYNQAVKNYQVVLKNKPDLSVLTDMATAAYYSGQLALAEESYQKALAINPNFPPALNNYGIFLYQVKKNYSTAIRMWQAALNQDPNGPNSAQLKKLINQAKEQ